MSRSRTLIALAVMVPLVGAVAMSAGASAPLRRSVEPVHAFADPDRTVGTSTLERTDEELRMRLRTTGGAPHEALTVWWVVFNQPERCDGACDADDLFVDGDPAGEPNMARIAAADAVVAYAAGAVSSDDGVATLTAALPVREAPRAREIVMGDGPTLEDAGAEVHLVVRSHGPVVEGREAEQTGSYAGGCDVLLTPPAVPDAAGECADVSFAIHLP